MRKFFSFKHSKKVLIIFALVIVIFLIPTPYLLYQPGTVENLTSKVTVEGASKEKQGSLNLTTVLSVEASNLFYLTIGFFDQNTEIRKKENVMGNLSEQEYDFLLKHMMDSSQVNAIASGFEAAGEKVSTSYNGIFITKILSNSKAKGILKIGDIIHSVDGIEVHKAEEFIDYMARDKHEGDQVRIVFSRDGVRKEASVEVITLDVKTKKVGLGIYPEDKVGVDVPKKVDINTSDIGGPSAGLMLSLEIYNQLKGEDMTKGYKIAGTGSIDLHGNVGQIGGIRQKIVAAHNEGVDIFFCPKDITKSDMNEKDIKDEAKKHGYDIKIVPVKTMREAVHYLETLEVK